LTFQGPRSEEAGPQVDPTGAPIEDAGPEDPSTPGTRPGEGRVLDRGAIYAGMVGLGLAVTIAISFELVVAIQALVFISAPIAGVVIGWYANNKATRWRPRWRLFANAGFAGLVTGLSLAFIYVGVRLLFIYADSGYRSESQGGQIECSTGPQCTYLRFVDDGHGQELAIEGIVDADTFETAVWRWQGETVLLLGLMTVAGSLVPAAWRAWRPVPPGVGLPVGAAAGG
jgi:hypothetical protein